MGRSVIETVLGAVVLGIAGLFLGFAYSTSNVQRTQGYSVTANFPMIDGIQEGTDVRLNGVKVGSIDSINLITQPGPEQDLVKIKMTVRPDVQLPSDTQAMIASESLLGGKYLSLEPGVEDDMIKTDGNGRITRTQAPMRLDDLIGQMIYAQKRGDGDSSKSSGNATPSPGPAPVKNGGSAPAAAHP